MGFVDLLRQEGELSGLDADLGDVGAEISGFHEARFPQKIQQVHRLEALASELGAAQDGHRVADIQGLQTEVFHVGFHILGQNQTPQGDEKEGQLTLVGLVTPAQLRFQTGGLGDGEVGQGQLVQSRPQAALHGNQEADGTGVRVPLLEMGPGEVQEAFSDTGTFGLEGREQVASFLDALGDFFGQSRTHQILRSSRVRPTSSPPGDSGELLETLKEV